MRWIVDADSAFPAVSAVDGGPFSPAVSVGIDGDKSCFLLTADGTGPDLFAGGGAGGGSSDFPFAEYAVVRGNDGSYSAVGESVCDVDVLVHTGFRIRSADDQLVDGGVDRQEAGRACGDVEDDGSEVVVNLTVVGVYVAVAFDAVINDGGSESENDFAVGGVSSVKNVSVGLAVSGLMLDGEVLLKPLEGKLGGVEAEREADSRPAGRDEDLDSDVLCSRLSLDGLDDYIDSVKRNLSFLEVGGIVDADSAFPAFSAGNGSPGAPDVRIGVDGDKSGLLLAADGTGPDFFAGGGAGRGSSDFPFAEYAVVRGNGDLYAAVDKGIRKINVLIQSGFRIRSADDQLVDGGVKRQESGSAGGNVEDDRSEVVVNLIVVGVYVAVAFDAVINDGGSESENDFSGNGVGFVQNVGVGLAVSRLMLDGGVLLEPPESEFRGVEVEREPDARPAGRDEYLEPDVFRAGLSLNGFDDYIDHVRRALSFLNMRGIVEADSLLPAFSAGNGSPLSPDVCVGVEGERFGLFGSADRAEPDLFAGCGAGCGSPDLPFAEYMLVVRSGGDVYAAVGESVIKICILIVDKLINGGGYRLHTADAGSDVKEGGSEVVVRLPVVNVDVAVAHDAVIEDGGRERNDDFAVGGVVSVENVNVGLAVSRLMLDGGILFESLKRQLSGIEVQSHIQTDPAGRDEYLDSYGPGARLSLHGLDRDRDRGVCRRFYRENARRGEQSGDHYHRKQRRESGSCDSCHSDSSCIIQYRASPC